MTKKKTKIKKKIDKRLQKELDKLGKEAQNIFVESKDNPDKYKEYPKIVVCSLDPQIYIYPIMLKLENSDIVKLEALNNYVSTILRVCELFQWCMDLRLKRKRQSINEKTGRILITNEYVLEKIPACRG